MLITRDAIAGLLTKLVKAVFWTACYAGYGLRGNCKGGAKVVNPVNAAKVALQMRIISSGTLMLHGFTGITGFTTFVWADDFVSWGNS